MARSSWDSPDGFAELPTTIYRRPVSRAGLHRLCVDCLNSPVCASTKLSQRCEPCEHKRDRRLAAR